MKYETIFIDGIWYLRHGRTLENMFLFQRFSQRAIFEFQLQHIDNRGEFASLQYE